MRQYPKQRGAGMSSLIPLVDPLAVSKNNSLNSTQLLSLEKISYNSKQPRKYFDETALEELARSIQLMGVIQPIVVNNLKNGRYEIIAGERRFRAAHLAGLSEVPVIIREESVEDHFLISLVENLVREDLDPIEEATAFQELTTTYDMSQDEIAQATGFSRAKIANALRLLNLPELVQADLRQRRYHAGHAIVLLMLPSNEKILQYREKLLNKHISVRELEVMIQHELEGRTNLKAEADYPSWLQDGISLVEQEIRSPVRAFPRMDGGGRLVIEYSSQDDFKRISQMFVSRAENK